MRNPRGGRQALTHAPEMFAEHLVAYYPFDDGTATDVSSHANNGTVHGVLRTEGKFGSGLLFNGSDSYVEIRDNPSPYFSDHESFFVSMWVKTKGHGSILQYPDCGGYCPSELANPIIYMKLDKNGQVIFVVRDRHKSQANTDYGATEVKSASPVHDGRWHLLVGVCDVVT